MPETIEIGPVSAQPGTRAFGYLPVATMASGAELGVPVHVVAGAESGPGLALVVGLHGHEYSAINILIEVLKQVDPSSLRGHLIMVPMANPVAFEHGAKSGWVDGLYGGYGDLNKTWPGSPDGWLTEKLAHVIASEVLPQSEVVIDFHGEAMGARNRNFYGYILSSDSDRVSNERLRELGDHLRHGGADRPQDRRRSWLADRLRVQPGDLRHRGLRSVTSLASSYLREAAR